MCFVTIKFNVPLCDNFKVFFRSLRLFFLPVWENKLIKDNEMKVKGKKKLMVHLSVMKHGL